MSERRLSPRRRRPDPYAAFSYEMERAESTRRAVVAAGVAITVLLAVVVGVVAVAIAGGEPSAEDSRTVAASTPLVTQSAAISAIETSSAEATATTEVPSADLAAQAEAESAAKALLAKPTARESAAPKPPTQTEAEVQRLSVEVGYEGYEPAAISAKADVPIVLSVGQGEGCAAGFLMPELGIALDNSAGPVTAELGALEPGEYRFTCGMDMVSGLLLVR